GGKKEEEFIELTRGGKTIGWEVWGSTETGGVGYRQLGKKRPSEFVLFDGIKLDEDGEGIAVTTPFHHPPSHVVRLADRFSITDDGFIHEGRLDRIFKWGGSRYSLTEVERQLADILGHGDVRCVFEADPNH